MTGMIKIRIYRFVLLLLCYLFFGSFLLFGQFKGVLSDSVKYGGLLSYECYWDSVSFVRSSRVLSKELGLFYSGRRGVYLGLEFSRYYLRICPMFSLVSGFSDGRRYRLDLGLGVRYRSDGDRGIVLGLLPIMSFNFYDLVERGVSSSKAVNNIRFCYELGYHYRYKSLRASFIRHHYGVLRKRLESYCGPDKLLRGMVLDVRERRELSKTDGGIRLIGSILLNGVSSSNFLSDLFEFRVGVLF
jgi:hypothetical protein